MVTTIDIKNVQYYQIRSITIYSIMPLKVSQINYTNRRLCQTFSNFDVSGIYMDNELYEWPRECIFIFLLIVSFIL